MKIFTKAYVIKSTSNGRKVNDYYPTAPIATKSLLDIYDAHIPQTVWEPAAGRGWISQEIIKTGRECISTDIYPYDEPLVSVESGIDYLKSPTRARCVITNPPYKNDLAQKFIEKALSETDFCAFFVRLTFMEGKKRHKLFTTYPPSVHVFSGRINCDESTFGDYKAQQSGMVAYAWFVWGKGANPGTISWIDADDHIPPQPTLDRFLNA